MTPVNKHHIVKLYLHQGNELLRTNQNHIITGNIALKNDFRNDSSIFEATQTDLLTKHFSNNTAANQTRTGKATFVVDWYGTLSKTRETHKQKEPCMLKKKKKKKENPMTRFITFHSSSN